MIGKSMVEEVICGFAAVSPDKKTHCINPDTGKCCVCNYVAPANYKQLEAAVKKTVEQYGETLRLLADS